MADFITMHAFPFQVYPGEQEYVGALTIGSVVALISELTVDGKKIGGVYLAIVVTSYLIGLGEEGMPWIRLLWELETWEAVEVVTT